MAISKYEAFVRNAETGNEYSVQGEARTPQEFHKTVLNEYIDYQKDEITHVKNMKTDKKVFDIKKGFSGS